jgi:hydrogenase expression/formation protein HypE
MAFNEKTIQMHHGDGGFKTSELIDELILKYLGNDILRDLDDSAVFKSKSDILSYTTDSYVISPIFFPGADIGRLSVCGTVNDLSTSGSVPAYLSLSLILEEGFAIDDLKTILKSIKETSKEAGVKIITGDIKVVPRGLADGIYINTSGIGFIKNGRILSSKNIREGDLIIINGTIGDHGLAVLSQRKEFDFKTSLKSDCAPLNNMIAEIMAASKGIRSLRDATRGGAATVLIEFSKKSKKTFNIFEEKIPIKEESIGICDFLGLDPLYIANEGKMIIFVSKDDAKKVMDILRANKYGKDSAVIGQVGQDSDGLVLYNTVMGTKRMLDVQYSEQLPRIC